MKIVKSNRKNLQIAIDALIDIASCLGGGPCGSVGCEGCSCEMQMAYDTASSTLDSLGIKKREE